MKFCIRGPTNNPCQNYSLHKEQNALHKRMDLGETLQQIILNTLDKDGSIQDTRNIQVEGESSIDQQVILGVLKRLTAHEVLYSCVLLTKCFL